LLSTVFLIVPAIVPDELTVKVTPLLACPFTVTTTGPVVAPEGTATAMLVEFQLVGDAVVPLNCSVLVPCVAPKLFPATVTELPTVPELGVRLVIEGDGGGTGMTTEESKLPFNVPSTSSSAKLFAVGDAVRLTPTHM
jgi:hypothetical protein